MAQVESLDLPTPNGRCSIHCFVRGDGPMDAAEPWRDTRAVVNGVLWILRTGAPRLDLPNRYPPYQTCHRRFQHWQRSGLLLQLLQKLAEDLRDRGKLDRSEAFVDASFSSTKKEAPPSVLLDAVRQQNHE
jgi:transposase